MKHTHKQKAVMKKITTPVLFAGIVVILALGVFLVWGLPYFFKKPTVTGINSQLAAQTYRARVVEIIESKPINMGSKTQTYQRANVRVLDGEYANSLMEIEYGRFRIHNDEQILRPGDETVERRRC